MDRRRPVAADASVVVDATVGLAPHHDGRVRTTPARQLRRLVAQPEPLLVPTAHDALSARLVELAGFEAVAMSRRAITAAMLASVDGQLADPQELLAATVSAVAAVSIPLIADLVPGPHDVVRLRRSLIHCIGVAHAGFVVGDALPGGDVLPRTEADGLIHAALDVRADHGDIVVIAKAHARGPEDASSAIERALRWAELGVDLVQVEHLESRADHEAFAVAVPDRRVHRASARLPAVDQDEALAREFGYSVIVWPAVLLEAAAAGMQTALDRINSERVAAPGDVVMPQADLDALLGARTVDDLRRRYRGGDS